MRQHVHPIGRWRSSSHRSERVCAGVAAVASCCSSLFGIHRVGLRLLLLLLGLAILACSILIHVCCTVRVVRAVLLCCCPSPRRWGSSSSSSGCCCLGDYRRPPTFDRLSSPGQHRQSVSCADMRAMPAIWSDNGAVDALVARQGRRLGERRQLKPFGSAALAPPESGMRVRFHRREQQIKSTYRAMVPLHRISVLAVSFRLRYCC